MLDEYLTACKSRDKVDFSVIKEVILLSLEPRVLLLFDFEDYVTWLNARSLVTFAPELNLMTCPHTSVYVYVEYLSLDDSLLSSTALALVLFADKLSFSVTIGADGLEALNHRAHLPHHGLHTVTIATTALLDSAFLATAPVALRTDDGFLKRKFGDFSSVDVFQRNFVDMMDDSSFWWSTVLHTSTEHASESTTSKG